MSEVIDIFNSLLGLAVENNASDIHVKSNLPANLRLHGHLEVVDMEPFTAEQVLEFIESVMPAAFYDEWKQNGQIDFSYDLTEINLGRFRVNGFYQRGTPTIVFRHVNDTPPSLDSLNHVPTFFHGLAAEKNGIVLVCGATGAGKSSTLAATLEYINENYDRHVVTLEDP
ncbi:MAG: ATPase, T2SS/T4P/T4SS family, partial [Verrucomicrobiota bacterium]